MKTLFAILIVIWTSFFPVELLRGDNVSPTDLASFFGPQQSGEEVYKVFSGSRVFDGHVVNLKTGQTIGPGEQLGNGFYKTVTAAQMSLWYDGWEFPLLNFESKSGSTIQVIDVPLHLSPEAFEAWSIVPCASRVRYWRSLGWFGRLRCEVFCDPGDTAVCAARCYCVHYEPALFQPSLPPYAPDSGNIERGYAFETMAGPPASRQNHCQN